MWQEFICNSLCILGKEWLKLRDHCMWKELGLLQVKAMAQHLTGNLIYFLIILLPGRVSLSSFLSEDIGKVSMAVSTFPALEEVRLEILYLQSLFQFAPNPGTTKTEKF